MTAAAREFRSKSQPGRGLRCVSLSMDAQVHQPSPHHVFRHAGLRAASVNSLVTDQPSRLEDLAGGRDVLSTRHGAKRVNEVQLLSWIRLSPQNVQLLENVLKRQLHVLLRRSRDHSPVPQSPFVRLGSSVASCKYPTTNLHWSSFTSPAGSGRSCMHSRRRRIGSGSRLLAHKRFKGVTNLLGCNHVVALRRSGHVWRKGRAPLGIQHCRFAVFVGPLIQALKCLREVVHLSAIRRSLDLFKRADKSVNPVDQRTTSGQRCVIRVHSHIPVRRIGPNWFRSLSLCQPRRGLRRVDREARG